MAATLRRFAASVGKPEKYHQTMTVFWIRGWPRPARAGRQRRSMQVPERAGPPSRAAGQGPASRVLLTATAGQRRGEVVARTRSPAAHLMPLRLIPHIHRATHRIGLYLADLREFGLSQGEAHILAHLAKAAPATINDLHRGLAHKRSTLTSILDRLTERGLHHPRSWRIRQAHVRHHAHHEGPPGRPPGSPASHRTRTCNRAAGHP